MICDLPGSCFLSLNQITALHIAAERGHIKIVEYLADKGADIDIQDKKGVLIYDYSNDSVIFQLAIYN